MAGMLPGVEAARRRRIYHGHGSSSSAPTHPSLALLSSPSSRRSTFPFNSPFTHLQRSRTNQVDDKLGELARQAKERLDERLRSQTQSLVQRNNRELREETRDRREQVKERELRTEVYASKRNKLIGRWAKLGWKTWEWEQHECAVCLDEFKSGDNLLNLPCSHRFHSTCLVPWLHSHTNAHCPCCRMSIFSSYQT